MESSSSSRWLENNNDHINHSQWLLSTLSDIDKKMNTILDLIEENGDTLIETGKMFFQKRPKLIELVQDVRKSYISLAHKYVQLKSESTLVKSTASSNHGGSFLNSSFIIQHQQTYTNTCPDSSSASKPRQLGDRKLSLRPSCSELGDLGESQNGFRFDELRLEIPKLVKDSLRQQGELIKRNDEKREKIKELEIQMIKLIEENNMLQGSLQAAQQQNNCAKKQENKSSSFSKFRGALLFGRRSHS